jgi:ATP sulfurylase
MLSCFSAAAAAAAAILPLLLISSRGFSPLEGFMDQEDYDSVVADMRTKVRGVGVFWGDLGFREGGVGF